MISRFAPSLELLRQQYASYHGYQEGYCGLPGFELWNLKKPIPGHPEHSTVSLNTLDKALRKMFPSVLSNSEKRAQFMQEQGVFSA